MAARIPKKQISTIMISRITGLRPHHPDIFHLYSLMPIFLFIAAAQTPSITPKNMRQNSSMVTGSKRKFMIMQKRRGPLLEGLTVMNNESET
jgi:hypothetical protein